MNTIDNKLYIFQKGFNYSQDGPGNRLVYHLSGCNLKCPWCSNPEGMTLTTDAEAVTTDDVIKETLSARMILIDGGGVTFTGGEVTCQKEAVLSLIRELQQNGINTCIETNASLTGCEELFSTVDYMIADFKTPCPTKASDVLGADLDIIKANLIYRTKTGKPLLVRIPLVHYFNCSIEDAHSFSEFFTELQQAATNDNVSFEILTYHEFGKEKYNKLGREYTVTDGYTTPEDARILAEEIKKRNLKLINT
ncbi:MAG: radical SAM protein [Clostridia bacterium]|nr:radical SAM protein [Clostridia bacterium]